MATNGKRFANALASGVITLAFCMPAAAQGLGLGSEDGGLSIGGANGVSIGPSKNGPLGVSANVGGARGVNADVGAGIGTSKGLASVDVDATVGGTGGITAKSNNSVAGSNGLVDSKTTASIGGANGVNANVSANVGGTGLANVDVGIGNTIAPGSPSGPGTPGGPGQPGGPIAENPNSPGASTPPGVRRAGVNLAGLSSSKVVLMKKRCLDVMANSGGYDRGLVELCAALGR